MSISDAATTTTTTTTETRGAKPTVQVDPTIAAIIGSAAAPAGVPPPVDPPASLPGALGLLPSVNNIVGLRGWGAEYSNTLRAQYGDIYRGMFLNQVVVYVWNPLEIQRMLRNDEGVWSAPMGWDATAWHGLDVRGGNFGALLSIDFDDHRAARRLVGPAFSTKALRGYANVMNPHFERTVLEWIERRRVDFKPAVRPMLARVANEIFTGFRDPAHVAIIDRALHDFWHGMMAISHNPRLSPTFRRAQRGFETLRTMFLGLIAERRRNDGQDLFSYLCRDEDKAGLSDEAMLRIFLSSMFGAYDTTTLAVTSMAYMLAKHGDWQQRLREEALQVAPERLDAARARDLQQFDMVWKETLRLMPVAGYVPRRSLRAVEISGHTLPAGTLAFAMIGGLGRHPVWWKDPAKFDPERFSPERAEDKLSGGILMPFGFGPHACAGTLLANLEMKLLFHKLLTSCRFTLAPDYDARHVYTPLGCVSGKVSLRFERLAT